MAHPINPYTGNRDVAMLDLGNDRHVCFDRVDGYVWGDATLPAGGDIDKVYRQMAGIDRPAEFLEYAPEPADGVHVHSAKWIDRGDDLGLPNSVEAGGKPYNPPSPFGARLANRADVGLNENDPVGAAAALRATAEAETAAARAKTDENFPRVTGDAAGVTSTGGESYPPENTPSGPSTHDGGQVNGGAQGSTPGGAQTPDGGAAADSGQGAQNAAASIPSGTPPDQPGASS